MDFDEAVERAYAGEEVEIPMETPKTLRLLRVVVQPVFAIDDGTELHETPGNAVTVLARDWPNYYQIFAQEFEKLKAQVAAS